MALDGFEAFRSIRTVENVAFILPNCKIPNLGINGHVRTNTDRVERATLKRCNRSILWSATFTNDADSVFGIPTGKESRQHPIVFETQSCFNKYNAFDRCLRIMVETRPIEQTGSEEC